MGDFRNHLLVRAASKQSSLRTASATLAVISFVGFLLPRLMTGNILAHTDAPPNLAGQTAVAGQVSSPVGRGAAGINLSAGREAPTRYLGNEGLKRLLEQQQARPLALAAADFDGDGTPDLVSGYAAPGGGILTLHRGNVDALFPNAPEAKRRRAAGQSTDSPFLAAARIFAAPAAPDFLHAGDFDADGHYDVVAAAQGGSDLLLLRGDGKGRLGPAERIALPGAVSAMAVGEINNRDGLHDVAVAIAGAAGPQALVFTGREGALRSAPEAFDLPAEAASLALGNLDDDYLADLAVAAGRELLVIRGQDKRVAANPSGRPQAAAAGMERRSLP
ncbi:MAG TPA: VCBS repeat-containing protein, partial [Blastocatellia bacterium]|nr:VCBS repeat-containing protein [Blastocatellia bacterium]